MPDASAGVEQALGAKAHGSVREIPPGVRWLAYLTTSVCHPPGSAIPAVASLAQTLALDGWMLRGAWARNYVLWQHGRTIQEARLPMLVLPLHTGHLSALHVNVFLAVELTAARARLDDRPRHGAALQGRGDLAAIMEAIATGMGITVADPGKLHGEASAYLRAGTMMTR